MAILKPVLFNKVITTAGTRERLTETNIKAITVVIQAADDNTDGVAVGDSTVDISEQIGIELNARETQEFKTIDPGVPISLKDIWVDADTSADEVSVMALVIS